MLGEMIARHYEDALEAKKSGETRGLGDIDCPAGASGDDGYQGGLSGKSCRRDRRKKRCPDLSR